MDSQPLLPWIAAQVGEGSRLPVFAAELIAAAAVIVIALAAPGAWAGWFDRVERRLGALARRRRLAIAAAALLPLLLRALLSPALPTPTPRVGDEFSYLMAAETFASGRPANPTHPKWVHFETSYVIHEPAYASMYPPGQGLLLAAGQALAGHAWAGVWLSVALMCGALCWMLQAWVPPGWALLGAAILALRVGVFSYWMNSYWGGALAAFGGALVLGAAPRIMRRPDSWNMLLFAAGIVVLANTRPYEGLVFSLPATGWLVVWILREQRGQFAHLARLAAPALGALAIAGAALGAYFWRVTGSPFLMPYTVHDYRYRVAPQFGWMAPRPEPRYRHRTMQVHFARQDREVLETFRTPSGFVRRTAARFRNLWLFFLGPLLSIPLIYLPRALRDRRMRLLLISGAATAVAVSLEVYKFPHYSAPATAVLMAFLVESLRRLHAAGQRGLTAARFIPVSFVLVLGFRLAAAPLGVPLNLPEERPEQIVNWCCAGEGGSERAELLRWFESTGGKHLVIVRYQPDHDPVFEWVRNGADIDASAVVWARDMGEKDNLGLIRYYGDRSVWLLEPDVRPPRLSPYKGGGGTRLEEIRWHSQSQLSDWRSDGR